MYIVYKITILYMVLECVNTLILIQKLCSQILKAESVWSQTFLYLFPIWVSILERSPPHAELTSCGYQSHSIHKLQTYVLFILYRFFFCLIFIFNTFSFYFFFNFSNYLCRFSFCLFHQNKHFASRYGWAKYQTH